MCVTNDYTIKIYETSSGKVPFIDWFNSLKDKKIQIAVDLRIERVKMGNLSSCKSLGEGVFELKIDTGPGYRIYFGKIHKQIILLLCAGSKKSQQKDIIKAHMYFKNFKDSGKKHG